MVDYSPLWVTMKKRGVTTYTLIYKLGFSAYTITNLRRNKSITMNTLEKLCQALSCTPNDVVRFIEEPEKRPVPQTECQKKGPPCEKHGGFSMER